MVYWPATPRITAQRRALPRIAPQRPSSRSCPSLPANAWQCGHPQGVPLRSLFCYAGNVRIVTHCPQCPPCRAMQSLFLLSRNAPHCHYCLVVLQWMAMRAPTRGAPTIVVLLCGHCSRCHALSRIAMFFAVGGHESRRYALSGIALHGSSWTGNEDDCFN